MTKNIDLESIRLLVSLLKPAPVAPVAPLPPVNGSGSMAKDLEYMAKDINEIKHTLKEITDTHVTHLDFQEHVKADIAAHTAEDKIIGDHEARIRLQETAITKVQTWGAAMLLVGGIVQAILFHFWK